MVVISVNYGFGGGFWQSLIWSSAQIEKFTLKIRSESGKLFTIWVSFPTQIDQLWNSVHPFIVTFFGGWEGDGIRKVWVKPRTKECCYVFGKDTMPFPKVCCNPCHCMVMFQKVMLSSQLTGCTSILFSVFCVKLINRDTEIINWLFVSNFDECKHFIFNSKVSENDLPQALTDWLWRQIDVTRYDHVTIVPTHQQ